MRDKIRELVAAASPKHRKVTDNGTTVVFSTPSPEQAARGAASREMCVNFASDGDAELFYAAGPLIMALCEELDESERRQAPDLVDQLENTVSSQSLEISKLRAQLATLEHELTKALEREEKLRQLAKLARPLQEKYVKLFDRARDLQEKLDEARDRARSLAK